MARAAIGGLALGLVALAVLAVWSTMSAQAATAKVRSFNRVSAEWNKVFTRASAEDAALREFLATGGEPHRRAPLRTLIGSAGSSLTWLERHGGAAEASQVRNLRAGYADYTRAILAVLGAPQGSAELDSYGELAQLNFTSLRDLVVANVERKQRELAAYLVTVDRESAALRWAVIATLAAELPLCVASMLVLLGYQRRAERDAESSRHQALHDALTGLANRQLLAERAERAVGAARREVGMTGLLLIDLDRFKWVNDTLGHHCGDLLLQQVARRLVGVARPEDTVARLGGDEFAVLLPSVESPGHLLELAEAIRMAIKQPVELNGLMVDFGASVGAAAFPIDSADAAELLRHADVAMYDAKRNGTGVCAYDPDSDEYNPMRLSVASGLRVGIDRGELVLHYQPKVDPATLTVQGVEALVRWQHPNQGLLPPVAFVPVVERTEIIDLLTGEVLRMAVAQAGSWLAAGRRVPVAVNVNARSLLNATFPDRVAEELDRHGVPADLLTVELTESTLIAEPELVALTLRKLRAHGVRVSIDDFGTGYSSMVFLRDLPIDELKIDQSFVMGMHADQRNHVLVKAMVELAASLGVGVVAEGVEDAPTLDELVGLACGAVQGYYISPPLAVVDLDAWLAAAPAGRVRSRAPGAPAS